MGAFKEPMKKELKILFHALCDGLRQEVRQRRLAQLVTGKDFSLTEEREPGVASSLALHLRLVGFMVQLESYFPGEDPKLRPDFCIWLPASKKYIYLELKPVAWGDTYDEYLFPPAIHDIEKLSKIGKSHGETDLGNGLIAVGFSDPRKQSSSLLLDRFKGLSQDISNNYPSYEEISIECIDLQEMDEHSPYAVIGLWFRKSLIN